CPPPWRSPSSAAAGSRESPADRPSGGRPRPPPSSPRRAAGCNNPTRGCGGDSRSSGRRSCSARTSRECPCVRTLHTFPIRRLESPAARDGARAPSFPSGTRPWSAISPPADSAARPLTSDAEWAGEAAAAFARDASEYADRKPRREHERAAVAEERQRNPGDRHQVQCHADVLEDVREPARQQSERDEAAECIVRALGDPDHPQKEKEKEREGDR